MTQASSAPRIGIIGARRVHQCLGPYIAKHLQDLGAIVPAFLGKNSDHTAKTQKTLADDFGVHATGYSNFDEMVAKESLDAIVIASPHDSHYGYLQSAWTHGLHVLCEKPFIWDCDDLLQEASRLVYAFHDKSLVLMENVQWPYTLDYFRDLYPATFGEATPVQQFSMVLAPSSTGIQMIVDCFSHVFSMLQAIAGATRSPLHKVAFDRISTDCKNMAVGFSYPADTGSIDVYIEMRLVPQPPRPATYCINGCSVNRQINIADYSMSFESADRTVAIADPMRLLLTDFVEQLKLACAGGNADGDFDIISRLAHLQQVVDAYHQASN